MLGLQAEDWMVERLGAVKGFLQMRRQLVIYGSSLGGKTTTWKLALELERLDSHVSKVGSLVY